MKLWIGILAAASLLCTAPVAAREPQHAPADLADLQCMALVAVMAGMGLEEGGDGEEAATRMAGLAGGMMYYLGRLEGRSPGTDWLAELGIYLDKVEPGELDVFGQRCGAELTRTGQALVDFGGKPAQTD